MVVSKGKRTCRRYKSAFFSSTNLIQEIANYPQEKNLKPYAFLPKEFHLDHLVL